MKDSPERDLAVADELGRMADARIKELEQRLAQCEGSRRVHELDNHHNALACGYCTGPIKDEITRLQSQLEQVTKERDDYRRRLKEWEL